MALEFTLRYTGEDADFARIDFYDLSQALVGFQRSLALTTHLVLNGEIITQAPSLHGATISVSPPSEGSWKITALVATTILTAGVAPHDSPVGHLLTSAYDYVLSESVGVHLDYEKTLGQLIQEANHSGVAKGVDLGKLDAVIEKCEKAITDIHRPISHTGTATAATLAVTSGGATVKSLGPPLDIETFDYLHQEVRSDRKHSYAGKVSSYNSNTFKGRLYVENEGRPVPFVLSEDCRSTDVIGPVVQSLARNAINRFDPEALVGFEAFELQTKKGRLKRYYVTDLVTDVSD